MGEKMGIVSSLVGMGKDMGDLPEAWICSVLVGMNCVESEEGRREAVVDASVGVVYSEGVYFEEGMRTSGMGSAEDMVELIILNVQWGCILCDFFSLSLRNG